MVKEVRIYTIPHGAQRYDTVGDWLYDPASQVVTIYVSELGDWRMNMACGIHEAIETMLCVNDGVDEADVSAFDIQFEKERQAGLHSEDDEPGEAVDAPYRKQHAFADGIERLLANALGVCWKNYSDKVVSLDFEQEQHAHTHQPK